MTLSNEILHVWQRPPRSRAVPKAPVGMSNDERFDRFVEPEPMSGCFLWLGNHTKWGHGYFSERLPDGTFKKVIAHRYAFLRAYGHLPERGMFVCHKCNNAACVNPSHLYAGTPKQNTDDCRLAGRHRSVRRDLLASEKNGRAVLDWHKVREIRTRFSEGGITKTELARQYGMSISGVGSVIRGKTWAI